MSNYVQPGDIHTSYEEDGKGEALVLLHPGLADSRAFEEYVPEFAHHFHIFRSDRRALTVADLAGYPGPASSWSAIATRRSP